VISEEIVVRDRSPSSRVPGVPREHRPAGACAAHSGDHRRPESLPLKRITQLLPDARVTERTPSGRVHWVLEQGPLDEMREMQANLPSDAPAWPRRGFSSAPPGNPVAAGYRPQPEARIRPEDARPMLAGLKAPATRCRGRQLARLHRQVVDPIASRSALHRHRIRCGAAIRIPFRDAEAQVRRLQGQVHLVSRRVARGSGIDAYLALLAAGDDQDVSPELPGLGMFDHAIVYVPGSDKGHAGLWIDATAEYTRVGTLPSADSGRLALIIRDGTRGLTRTPDLRSADNRQVETREFFLSEYGPSARGRDHGNLRHGGE
jgi:hypothetical protein